MHAIAFGLAVLAACGESLPASEEGDGGAPDGTAADASDGAQPSNDADVDAAADAGCVAPCNVTEIATAKPTAIAASQNVLAWLSANETSALVDGGVLSVMTTLNGGASTGFLALDGTNAFMTQNSGVDRCSTAAPCADNPAAPIFGLADTGPIAIANGELYAADRGASMRLVMCGATQSCGSSVQVLAYLPAAATRIALTSTYVVVGFVDGALRGYRRADRLEAGTGAPPPFAVAGDLRGLAVDGSDVYWTDAASGRISRVTTASPAEFPLLENRKFPRAIAIDGARRAYWVETDDDAVLRCTLPACTDVTVIARVRQPTDLALGDRVYVASETAQRIYATAP